MKETTVRDLDTTDPVALEAALDALPVGTVARVVTASGETLDVTRCPGGWYLDGDLAVTSGDVADGRPARVSVMA
jgi:hypothetical protein